MTKHTPGILRAATIIHERCRAYANVKSWEDSHTKELIVQAITAEAIADLIAEETAAPDLLKACKMASDYVTGAEKELGIPGTSLTLQTLTNAIAKAEPKQ